MSGKREATDKEYGNINKWIKRYKELPPPYPGGGTPWAGK